MRAAWLQLLTVCLLLAAAPLRAQDDEAWIESHLRAGGGTAIVAAPINRTPDRIAIGELSRFIGRDVRLHLSSGRVRDGLLEQVKGTQLVLRARMPSGYATVSLSRKQVLRAELE